MNFNDEYAKSEFEYNGKRWMVTVHNYWLIPGKPVELVWSLWKPTAYGGWVKANTDRAPKAVVAMCAGFYNGFMAAIGAKEREVKAA